MTGNGEDPGRQAPVLAVIVAVRAGDGGAASEFQVAS